MNGKKITASIIGVAIVIGIGVFLFTNIDELTFSIINESLEKVEVDTTTFNRVTNTFPVTTECELSLIFIESYYRPTLGDHTEWYYQNFGDILDEYKKDIAELTRENIDWDDPRLELIHREYIEKIKTRINPSLLEEFPFSKPQSGTTLVTISSKHLEEDPECADILKTNFKDLIYVMEDNDYQKLLEYAQSEPQPVQKTIEQKQDDPYAFKAEQICDSQTSSSPECALVLEQATIDLQNADKKLEKSIKRWKDICRGTITGSSCDQEFFVVQEVTNDYLSKNKKMLSIIYSTDERLVEFGQLTREYTLWTQFCDGPYVTDTMCGNIEITSKKLDEINTMTINECINNHNDICDKRILQIFALCTSAPLFENMKICSDPKYKNYVENSDFPT